MQNLRPIQAKIKNLNPCFQIRVYSFLRRHKCYLIIGLNYKIIILKIVNLFKKNTSANELSYPGLMHS